MPSKPPSMNGRPKAKPCNWNRRRSAEDRGYGSEHRAIRKRLLAEEPLCRACDEEGVIEPAVIADHVVPLSEGGETVWSNYQPLCKRHSDRKTALEAARSRTAR